MGNGASLETAEMRILIEEFEKIKADTSDEKEQYEQIVSFYQEVHFTPENVQTYKSHFENFDVNSDGLVSIEENVVLALQSCGKTVSLKDAVSLTRKEAINFQDFLYLAMKLEDDFSQAYTVEQLIQRFQEFDKDKNGTVDIDEFSQVMNDKELKRVRRKKFSELSEGNPLRLKIQAEFDQQVKNEAGKIDYEAFVKARYIQPGTATHK